MNHDEIEDRFIAAAKTEMRRRVEGVRPAEYGSSMPDYCHTQADVFGWGGKRFQEEREAFYRRLTNQVSAQDISELHECERWAALIDDIVLRRALWGWSRSKAGGEAFKAWCARERIKRETGRRATRTRRGARGGGGCGCQGGGGGRAREFGAEGAGWVAGDAAEEG